MKKNRFWFVFAGLLILAAQTGFARDDFGKIVQHIEVQYHVHRQHRFAMGLAGFVFKFYHFAGVKSFKGVIFENQPFLNAGADTRLDEIIRGATDSGWQPMLQSWDRRSGERTYIYVQDLGRDMRLLLVTLESNEAVVLQVKVDPRKVNEFVAQVSAGRNHHAAPEPVEEAAQPAAEAAATSHAWDGTCLIAEEAPAVEFNH
jgi:hypothetical protein